MSLTAIPVSETLSGDLPVEAVSAVVEAPAAPEKDYTALIQRTLEGIEKGLRQRETAFIVQIIELVREMSLKVDSLSVHQMAEIIGRDLTTMTRLMKMACTVGYNPEGTTIGSLNEAIQVIGYNRIRNIALSLLLLQNANRRWSQEEFDDVSSVMLTSSLMAETLATDGGRRMDADHIFLCAALRNYGKLLLASFFPNEYRDALKLVPERGEGPAFRECFGQDALGIAREVLGRAKLPAPLLRCLDNISPSLYHTETPSSHEEQLLVIDFSIRFCELLARLRNNGDFEAGYADLLRDHGRALCCTRDDMKRLLEDTHAKIEIYRRSMPSPIFANRVVQNIQALLDDQPLVPKPEVKRTRTRSPEEDIESAHAHNPERVLRLGLRDLDRLLEQEPVDQAVAWALATRLLWRGLELENSLLLLQQAAPGRFEMSNGFGSATDNLRDNGLVNAREKTIFSVSLAHGRDVIIQRPQDTAILPFVPPWLKPLATGALLVLPITDEGGTFALLTGIARPGQTLVLSPKTMEHLLSLRRKLSALRHPAMRAAA